MANGSVLPKHIRRLNSSALPLLRLAGSPDHAPADASDVNLDDAGALFKPVSTGKLLRSAATLQMAAFGPMVDVGIRVMGSRLMEHDLVRKAVLGFTEMTFYDHFCGGADLTAAGETVKKLWGSGLSAMLDYGLEHSTDNESCDSNTDVLLDTIDSSKALDHSAVSFVVVKITSICTPKLLKRVSDLLRWEYRDSSLRLPWKLNSFPVLSPGSPFYHTATAPPPLSEQEEEDLQLAYRRLDRICTRAVSENTRLLIDAEDTSIQPAIDYLAYSAAVEHSSGDRRDPVVFNTIQAYLKDAGERLAIAKEAADVMGVRVGFKLVRGAYMSSERRLAAEMGAESPVHDTIRETHDCYDGCAEFLLQEIAGGSGSVVLATHNVRSGKMTACSAVNLGIRKDNPNIHFAQLYGMSEALSLGLKNAGFKVSKYLPFGPVEQIMPYLLRRAEENRGLLSSSSLDRQLMRKEIMRRLLSRSRDS